MKYFDGASMIKIVDHRRKLAYCTSVRDDGGCELNCTHGYHVLLVRVLGEEESLCVRVAQLMTSHVRSALAEVDGTDGTPSVLHPQRRTRRNIVYLQPSGSRARTLSVQ